MVVQLWPPGQWLRWDHFDDRDTQLGDHEIPRFVIGVGAPAVLRAKGQGADDCPVYVDSGRPPRAIAVRLVDHYDGRGPWKTRRQSPHLKVTATCLQSSARMPLANDWVAVGM